MRCARCERREAAPGDPYCSTRCAKIASGVMSPEEVERNRRLHRKIAADERQPWVEVENPYRNRDRHEGPKRKRRG